MAGYIARIRYENPLPPPAFPPKLLNVPGTGLAATEYLTPGYASRLWREQPLNIEADAELGMPLNLVGMPGIFDGDESSIQAPDRPPPLDPKDIPLLRKPHQLGKTASTNSSVSFLRRTEYISSEANRPRTEISGGRMGKSSGGDKRKRPLSDIEADNPMNILQNIVKGFDIANPESIYEGPDTATNIKGHKPTTAELDAWNNPQHPTKKHLSVVDTYPVLPDLDAFPDSGGYMVMKFITNPLAASTTYDERLDVGLLRPLELRPDVANAHQAAVAAHEADPTQPPPPPPPFDYEFSVPSDSNTAKKIKKAFDANNPDHDDPALYDMVNKENGEKAFRYSRVRAYETALTSGSALQRHDEVVVALHEPSGENGEGTTANKQKAAYYYPLLQKSQIRPRRSMAQQMGMVGAVAAQRADDLDASKIVDFLDVTIRDANEEEQASRDTYRAMYDQIPDAEGDGAEDEDNGEEEAKNGGGTEGDAAVEDGTPAQDDE